MKESKILLENIQLSMGRLFNPDLDHWVLHLNIDISGKLGIMTWPSSLIHSLSTRDSHRWCELGILYYECFCSIQQSCLSFWSWLTFSSCRAHWVAWTCSASASIRSYLGLVRLVLPSLHYIGFIPHVWQWCHSWWCPKYAG